MSAIERDRAGGQDRWHELYGRLVARHDSELAPADWEMLADAAWWLTRVDESMAARERAYAGYVAAGDAPRAGYNAWMLSTEYAYVGKPSRSSGWLRKAQRQLNGQPECLEQAFLAYGEAEVAEAAGDLEAAFRLAERTVRIGQRCGSRDAVALGTHLRARLLVTTGRGAEGMALFDEAMVDVLTGDLGDLVTGWVYCDAVAAAFEVADLQRATEWNAAAMAWCETAPAGTPFHGLCRIHHVELLGLGGQWDAADAEVGRACDELMAYHPHMAAEGFYVAGDLHRRRGDLPAAEAAFRRAHALGRDPQPGLALVRVAQGDAAAAVVALRSAVATTSANALGRARLLAALVEAALAADDHDTARDASGELQALADAATSSLVDAMAGTARGAVHLADRDLTAALERLRDTRRRWLDLGLPYEAARCRQLLAAACRANGDEDAAHLELRAARDVFARLGAERDVRLVDESLGAPRGPERPGNLTSREVEVLRLVAAGLTNRAIATELVISEHTVARHLNNIFTKLGVSTRTAASAFAHSHDLV